MDKFNIAQGNAINDPTWRVIDGQRTDSGHLAAGAKVLCSNLERHEALKLVGLLNEAYSQGRAQGGAELLAAQEKTRLHFGYGPAIMGKLTPCCANEDRSMAGGCRSCGDPCL